MGDTFTFAFVAGAGDTDNALFDITGADLKTQLTTTLDFETKSSYSVRVLVTDSMMNPFEEQLTITVNNLAPSVPTDGNAGANTVAENAANGSTVGVTASSTDPAGGTVVYGLTDNAGGRFAIDASTGVVTVANGTLLDFESATSHNITARANDGTLNSGTQSFTINVTAVNDAPTLMLPVPSTKTVIEDNDLPINGTSVADADLLGAPLQVALSASHGVITLATTTGLTFNSGGDGTNSMAFRGQPAQVNAALTTLLYHPLLNFNGSDKIDIAVADLGFSGAGGAQVTTGSINITVTAVPDAPQITSQPAATPNPAVVRQNIDFTVAGSDGDNDTLAISWDFGDGTTDIGGNASHFYAAPGTYTATATVMDPSGLSASGTISIVITPAVAVGGGDDSDGDGFSDAIETTAGTSPNNAADTPVGGGAAEPEVLRIEKFAATLNFSKTNSDALEIGGLVPLPANFNFRGQRIVVDIGGVLRKFILNEKLMSPKGNDTMALKIDTKVRMFRFAVKLKKASIADKLSDEGLTTTAGTRNVTVRVTMVFGLNIFTETVTKPYTGGAKTGKAK